MEYRFALAGDPVAHSLSPVMHRAALESAGLEGSYEAMRCDESGFDELVAETRSGSIHGLNVTMPHKSRAHAACDLLTEEAALSASVNTMKGRAGDLVGHSTDVVAFRSILGSLESTGPVVVLGTGGSARAALAALRGSPVLVWARNRERITALQERFGDMVQPLTHQPAHAVVINCTPLGMRGEELPEKIFASWSALIDLPYGRADTHAVAAARADGIDVVDGIEFLATQAAASFTWWTGVEVDIGTMIRAARNA